MAACSRPTSPTIGASRSAPAGSALSCATSSRSRERTSAAIDTGEPVDRPVELDEDDVVEHDAWVIRVLAGELHMSSDEIAALSEDEAKKRVYAHWS